MGDTPDLDLTSLHFLPAWAKESEPSNRYSNYSASEAPSQARPKKRFSDKPQRPQQPFHSKKPTTHSLPRRDFQPAPLIEIPGLKVTFIPEEKGLISLARQIKLTSRAYPVFDIARMILQKSERYYFQLDSTSEPSAASLYHCPSDDSLWLTEEEALKHLLTTQFDQYYRIEKIPTDPPKGNYNGVAVCGLSGTVLGPSNYHDYSNQVRKLHQERFSHMPFDKFKSRIKTVTDEQIVNKWKEEQSFRSEYHLLQNPETEPLKTRAEVDTHFQAHYFPQLIQKVTTFRLNQPIKAKLSSNLYSFLRNIEQEERRFPIRLVHYLSQELGKLNLKFFKAHKNITYTAIARPQYLDIEQTPVSDSIKQIIDFIQNNPKPNRYQLLTALSQTSTATPSSPNPSELSPQEIGVLRDLHWLIQQGHVIEFANGQLELARKPKPKPEPPSTAAPAISNPTETQSSTIEPSAPSVETAQSETPSEDNISPS